MSDKSGLFTGPSMFPPCPGDGPQAEQWRMLCAAERLTAGAGRPPFPMPGKPAQTLADTLPPDVKNTNPKDVVGSRKLSLACLPVRVLWRVALAMMEGALKYGRHNYRFAGVRASVYFDAVVGRHLFSWWEGEDIDADSGLSHIDKAIAGLMVMRDSMLQGNFEDDRPPVLAIDMAELNAHASKLIDRYGAVKPRHYTIDDSEVCA